MYNSHILLVDDEQGLLKMLRKMLNKEGFQQISTAATGNEAIKLVKENKFHIIVLDVMLPDMDGFELCLEIRKYTTVPILFLSARSGDFDKVRGLMIGADDYITKPFAPMEVAARIQAHLRRQRINKETKPALDFRHFRIYKEEGVILLNNEMIHCTAKEFELLVFLCEHPNYIFTGRELYERIWGTYCKSDEKTVVVHISRLRRKLEENPKEPKMIITFRGLGYKFVPPTKNRQS
ncbi:response regulator transcription factor [Metabacillus fastidiosus]|uniref:response regulator transcription factor n=1 Tax=Metabacillus fastidiosus TaxID=1458 RepID=UPI003D286F28